MLLNIQPLSFINRLKHIKNEIAYTLYIQITNELEIIMDAKHTASLMIYRNESISYLKTNQRNTHLISGPSISTKRTKPGYKVK